MIKEFKGNSLMVKKKILLLFIIIMSCICVLLMAKQKPGMVLDEYFSYGLANSTYETNQGKYCIYLPQGIAQEPQTFFDNYFFATSFSPKDVWANQSYDVHPPMFYLILHALGRLTHNEWGFFTGIILNLVLHVINIILIYIIIRCVIEKEFWADLGSTWYAFLPVVVEHALYIRMYYLMLTCFLTLTLWMLIGYRIRNKKIGIRVIFYIGLGILSIFGVLTHYYFVIYLALICLVWGLFLLYEKRFKEIVAFLITMGMSGGSCLLIFPGMKYHIFEGNRGQQSIDSLLHSNFRDFLIYYGEILGHLAGGLLILLAVCGMLCWIGFVRKYRKKLLDNINWDYMMLIIPAVMYYFVISKIGVIRSSRFISPVFGVMIIVFTIILYQVHKWVYRRFEIRDIILKAVFSSLVIVMIGIEWYNFTWNELSMDNHEAVEIAKQYGDDNDCFYIWENSENSMVSYPEFIEYEHIYFWQKDTPIEEMKSVLDNYEHLVIYFNCINELDKEKQKEYLDEILEQSSQMTSYTHLYDGIFNCAYYLE